MAPLAVVVNIRVTVEAALFSGIISAELSTGMTLHLTTAEAMKKTSKHVNEGTIFFSLNVTPDVCS